MFGADSNVKAAVADINAKNSPNAATCTADVSTASQKWAISVNLKGGGGGTGGNYCSDYSGYAGNGKTGVGSAAGVCN
jgi:hypothetical protein